MLLWHDISQRSRPIGKAYLTVRQSELAVAQVLRVLVIILNFLGHHGGTLLPERREGSTRNVLRKLVEVFLRFRPILFSRHLEVYYGAADSRHVRHCHIREIVVVEGSKYFTDSGGHLWKMRGGVSFSLITNDTAKNGGHTHFTQPTRKTISRGITEHLNIRTPHARCRQVQNFPLLGCRDVQLRLDIRYLRTARGAPVGATTNTLLTFRQPHTFREPTRSRHKQFQKK